MPPALARRPCLLIIRDGWGENPDPAWDHANAVKLAKPDVDARLRRDWPFALVATSGLDVGLPEGTMGNSEVGHQNIGAGRIVDQDAVRVSRCVWDGSIDRNEELAGAMEHCSARGSALHLMTLASDAGVHSRLEHLLACVEMAARRGLARVFLHAFTDGRDSPPHSGLQFIARIEEALGRLKTGRIATVCGRYFAMDRDHRWDRTEKTYRLLTAGAGRSSAGATEALEWAYAHPPEPTMNGDEFVPPTVIGEPAPIQPGDSVIFTNFRGDRPRQLVQAFVLDEFPYVGKDKMGQQRTLGFERGPRLDLRFVTMTAYEAGLPVRVAFPKLPRMINILGEYVSKLGLRQFRCAETEKYAHVTFFFNDYREEPFPGEERYLAASPKVSTYDQMPEMSAEEVTQAVIRRLDAGVDDLLVVNYANPDMVGHTGSLPAAIKACSVVDACVGRLLDKLKERGGCAIVTADHGNLEQMIDPETGGPHTSHTVFPVPLYVVGAGLEKSTLRSGGRLADVAPTLLRLLGLAKPAEMTGESLIRL